MLEGLRAARLQPGMLLCLLATPPLPVAASTTASEAGGCERGPEIPNPDYQVLGPGERAAVVDALEAVPCSCGCTLDLLECAFVDPVCPSGRRLVSAAAWFAREGRRGVDLATATLAFERRVPAHASGPGELGPPIRLTLNERPRIGPVDAAVTVVILADWRNPEAAQMSATIASLRRRFGDDVAVVLKAFPPEVSLGLPSEAAALLVAQAEQRTDSMLRALSARSKPWDPASLDEAAGAAGLNPTTWDAARSGGSWNGLLSDDYREVAAASIGQAPAIVINGRLYRGGQQSSDLAPIIESLIRAGRASAAEPSHETDGPQLGGNEVASGAHGTTTTRGEIP